MNSKLAAIFLMSSCFAASSVAAHSLAFRVGTFAPRFESDLWADNFETFTLGAGDFDAVIGGVEVALDVSELLDLSFGVETTSKTVFTNYRDFVRDDDTEIFQDSSLRTTPVTAGVRFSPLGKRQRVVPYIAGGAAFYLYEYREEGEFIDFDTFDIFDDVFRDRGVAYGAYLGAGAAFGVTEMVSAFAEYRRHWARGTHGDDFDGFGRFDMTANQWSFGVNLRF